MNTKLGKVLTYSEMLRGHVTISKIYIFIITRVIASKPGSVLTYESMFSTQTLKS